MPEEDKTELTAIANRPVKMTYHLSSTKGVLVQCRMASGGDAFVPLNALSDLLLKEIVTKIKMQGGPR